MPWGEIRRKCVREIEAEGTMWADREDDIQTGFRAGEGAGGLMSGFQVPGSEGAASAKALRQVLA